MAVPVSVNSNSSQAQSTTSPTKFGNVVITTGVGGGSGFSLVSILLTAAAVLLVWHLWRKRNKN